MTSLDLNREEFAAKRRSEQDDLIERLQGVIGATFSTGDVEPLVSALENIYREVYDAEVEGLTAALTPTQFKAALSRFIKAAREMLSKADEKSNVRATSLALANAVLNDATAAAYEGDVEMEWVSMRDEDVRHTHTVADGQRRPIGEKFTVGESKMRFPGDITAPISEWINCRCSLRPVRADPVLAAIIASFAEPIEFAKHDVIFVENRRTPKIVPKGEPYEPSEAEGKITKRRAATEAEEKTIAKGDWVRVNEDGKTPGDEGYKEDRPSKVRPQNNSLAAAASKEGGDWFAIMAVPAESDPVHSIGAEEKHATVIYFGELSDHGGDDSDDIEHIKSWTHQIAADAAPFTAKVKGIEPLGHPGDDGQAMVWLLEDSDLNGIHEGLMADEQTRGVYEESDTTKYPTYTPHVTIGYQPSEEDQPENYDPDTAFTDETYDAAKPVEEIAFDRLSVWHGGVHTDYLLGEPMPDDIETEEPTTEEVEAVEESVVEDSRIPFHGVLAPENTPSGDGRTFTNLGRTRDLPLPMTWQEMSADGHDASITVGMIEKIAMIDGLMHYSGHFLSSVDEADEVIGLISEFGKFGVSVDADDIGSAAYDEDTDMASYDDPRVCSAAIVSIPAFMEAFIMLGLHDVLDAEEPAEEEEAVAASAKPALISFAGVPEKFRNAAIEQFNSQQAAQQQEQLSAEAEAEAWAAIEQFADLAPGKTEDGPGWLTHPVDTDRLRDYWVRGPGAAKIAWGVPGDFNRCRVNVGEYVKPQHLNGYCANRHYDALGVWPGREAAAAEALELSGTDVKAAPALTLVASAVGHEAPSEWFTEPVDLGIDDGVVITEEGRVMGYVAEWGVCHIGYDGICKEAPPSASNYAYFATGQVNTPDGPVKVGVLTSATGHADPRLKAMPAAAHYDNTGSAWAMVALGENERGIWFSGMVHPKADPELLKDVVASGRISGDWRPIGNDLELVAGLTVNVPGFPIVQTMAAAENGHQLSLVAAGVPALKNEEGAASPKGDPDLAMIASLVADEMDARQARRARFDALKQKMEN